MVWLHYFHRNVISKKLCICKTWPTFHLCYRTNDSDNLRSQPKFIVFLSRLLLLFNICPACKTEKPFLETTAIGTMVQITTICVNPHCPSPRNTWESQPNMTATKMPAINFLLCFSILVSGASPSKVIQVFKNMGLACITLKTYFKHQAVSTSTTNYLLLNEKPTRNLTFLNRQNCFPQSICTGKSISKTCWPS